MKKISILLLIVFYNIFTGQEISTIAGTGVSNYNGDGISAISANLSYPSGITEDNSGNLYFADSNNNKIRKISTSGIISTVAGNGTAGFSGDNGPATDAKLNSPSSVKIDNDGNLYIADASNHRIRKVDALGIISTIAGNGITNATGGGFYSGDGGAATLASLNGPQEICLDNLGNLYITDYINNRIRKVDSNGIITTIAGNGLANYSGDNGLAINASLNLPSGITVDSSGNIYLADTGNQRIRKIDTNGIITTVAGNGIPGYFGDNYMGISASLNYPNKIVLDENNNLYISDAENNRIRKLSNTGIITTIAGTGLANFCGDNMIATSSCINRPFGVLIDNSGNLLVSDTSNHRIRKVNLTVLNVENINIKKANVIFPNPFSNYLEINVDMDSEIFLYNSFGNLIKKYSLSKGKSIVETSSIPIGVYILKIDNKSYKLIKK